MPRSCGNRDENAGCSSHRPCGHVIFAAMAFVAGIIHCDACAQSIARPVDPAQLLERTSFQTGAPWDPMLQLPADVAMCYGVGKDLGRRIKLWKDQGYIVHVMTGVAWGNYQDYLYGKFDGKRHVNEAQTDRWGKVISHGGDVYYMCPGPTFGDYLAQRVLAAIEAGAQAIHLEEPEFWSRAGYSEGFKRAWRAAYGEDWVAPHTSADAQYRASRLKYDLYRQALKQVFDAIRADNKKSGRDIIAAGLEGSSPEAGHELRGRFIDLFAPGLPIVTSVKLNPHSRVLLFDIEQAQKTFPRVLASACKVLGETHAPGQGLSFVARGPDQTEALIRVGLSGAPRRVTVNGEPLAASLADMGRGISHSCLSAFPTKRLGSGL